MLPTDPKARKQAPVYEGFLKYFPDAVVAVANLSFVANEQHNPGQPVHWNRAKSTDELDCMIRHLLDHASGNPVDTDGLLHLAKVAWRAMAALQKELEKRASSEDSDKQRVEALKQRLAGMKFPTFPGEP